MTVTGNVTINNSADITNYGSIKARGDVNINNGKFTNYGIIDAKKNFNNGGTFIIRRNGSLLVHGSLTNNSPGRVEIRDRGLLKVKGTLNNNSIVILNAKEAGFFAHRVRDNNRSPALSGCNNRRCSKGARRRDAQSDPIVLPVELLFFRAVVSGKEIKIEWKTASERNNDHFNLYRAFGSGKFEKVHQTKGHGTLQTPQYYQAIDHPMATGNYYYQLEQVDYDGKSEIFPVTKVKWYDDTPESELKIYPMPARSGQRLFIPLSLSNNAAITASLLNMSGKKIKTLDAPQNNGRVELQLPSLVHGLYLLRIQTSSQQYFKKIVIQ